MGGINENKLAIPSGMFDPLFYDDAIKTSEVATKPFDPAKYIKTDEDRQDLMDDAQSSGHQGYIDAASKVVESSIRNE